MKNKTRAYVWFFSFTVLASAAYYAPIVAVLAGTDWLRPEVRAGNARLKPTDRLITESQFNECSGIHPGPTATITVNWDTWKPRKELSRGLGLPGVWGYWSWALLALAFFTVGVMVIAFFHENFGAAAKDTAATALVLLCVAIIIMSAISWGKSNALARTFADANLRQVVIREFERLRDLGWCATAGFGGYAVLVLASLVAGFILAAILAALRDEIEGAVLGRAKQRGVNPETRHTLILRSDETELREAKLEVEWLPWPQAVLREEHRAVMRTPELLSRARQISQEADAEATVERVTQEVQSEFDGVAHEIDVSFRTSAMARAHDEMARQVSTLTSGEVEQYRIDSRKLLQETSDRTLGKFREDLVAGALETASDELAPFKKLVSESLRGRVVDTLRSNQGGVSTLLPDCARFFFTHGPVSMVVVEQIPQVRTLYWRKSSLRQYIADLAGRGVTVTEEMEKRIERPLFELALPFLVFMIRFNKGAFHDLWLACRTEPLSSVDDELRLPPLPHVRRADGLVCLGDGFQAPKNSIAGITQAVLAYFWQSRFDYAHWDHHFRRGGNMHQDLDTLWSWEEASKRDPYFVLKADFPTASQSYTRTLAEFWKSSVRETLEGELMTYDALIARAMEDGEAALKKVIMDFIRAVSVERRYPRTILEELNRALDGQTKAIMAVVQKGVDSLPASTEHETVRAAWSKALYRSVSEVLSRRVTARGTVIPDLTTQRLIDTLRSYGNRERRG